MRRFRPKRFKPRGRRPIRGKRRFNKRRGATGRPQRIGIRW